MVSCRRLKQTEIKRCFFAYANDGFKLNLCIIILPTRAARRIFHAAESPTRLESVRTLDVRYYGSGNVLRYYVFESVYAIFTLISERTYIQYRLVHRGDIISVEMHS